MNVRLWVPCLSLILCGCGATAIAPVPSAPLTGPAAKIVQNAKEQLSWGTRYDARYVRLPYPGGDVPKDRGVCTDVVIRSLRAAGYDLQKLIHEDLKAAWSKYPRYGGLNHPDRSIDHRRVPNQKVFFRRQGLTLPKTVDRQTLKTWQPGDIVCWKLDNGRDHTGVLSDKRNSYGIPYVIHNLSTTAEEDCLTEWEITGHFRYPK
jgi:uncharacterized protein